MEYKKVHISEVRAGDAILHNGKIRTLCNRTIRTCSFMGKTLFGDSYKLGYELINKVHKWE